MAASATKLELTQLLAKANAELEALRLRTAELEGSVTALRNQLSSVEMAHAATLVELAQVKARVHNPRPGVKTIVRPAYVPTPEQLARREAMAAAKARAMELGRTVLVET